MFVENEMFVIWKFDYLNIDDSESQFFNSPLEWEKDFYIIFSQIRIELNI